LFQSIQFFSFCASKSFRCKRDRFRDRKFYSAAPHQLIYYAEACCWPLGYRSTKSQSKIYTAAGYDLFSLLHQANKQVRRRCEMADRTRARSRHAGGIFNFAQPFTSPFPEMTLVRKDSCPLGSGTR
jgi:hypothetical protein